MVLGDGVFTLKPEPRIYTDSTSSDTGKFLARRLRAATGFDFKIQETSSPDLAALTAVGILLTTRQADPQLGNEGYELTATANGIVIRAPAPAGLFYGEQTLLQLLPPEIFSSNAVAGIDWVVPCVQIKDWPRFPWRGLMLDVSRHFFDKQEVESLLDVMTLHKISMFHWHLVGEQRLSALDANYRSSALGDGGGGSRDSIPRH